MLLRHEFGKQYILCSTLMCITKARVTKMRNATIMLVEKDALPIIRNHRTREGLCDGVSIYSSLVFEKNRGETLVICLCLLVWGPEVRAATHGCTGLLDNIQQSSSQRAGY